jgi:hypothetical protein
VNAEQTQVTGELAASLSRPVVRPSELAPGLYYDVPEADYHAREVGIASKSALDLVHKSPRHYKAWLDGEERDPTPAMAFGKLVHTAVLEPHLLPPVLAGGRKGAQDLDTAKRIAGAVRAHPIAGKILRQGRAEVVARWDDPELSVACKGRLDWYDPEFGVAFDLKTTSDASQREFARSVSNFRYHVQAAMYLSGLRALGMPAEYFLFGCVEKVAPFAVAVYVLDVPALDTGERAMRRDMRVLAECCATGLYPSYPETITTLSMPAWSQE